MRISCAFVFVIFTFCSVSLPAQTADSPAAVAFPTFGVSFVPPAHATYSVPGSPGHVAYYTLGAESSAPDAALRVVVGMAHDQTLDALAGMFVAKLQATLDPAAGMVGGEKARKITQPLKGGAFTRSLTYLVLHDGRLYMFSALSGNAAASQAVEGVLADLVATVHFAPPDSPAKHLDTFFAKPFMLFNYATMNGPDCLRPSINTPERLAMGITDFTHGDPVLLVEIDRLTIPDGSRFSDIRAKFSAKLKDKMHLDADLKWETSQRLPRLYIAEPVKSRSQGAGGTAVSTVECYYILDMGPGELVQILFSIPERPDVNAQTYVDLSDKMIESLQLLGAAGTAK